MAINHQIIDEKTRAKTAKESLAISSDLILPRQTNHTDTLFGGELLSMLDKIAYISACKHARCNTILTVAVNNVSFQKKIYQGSILTLEAKVSRAFRSSMEVIIETWVENVESGERTKTNQAFYTFAALDQNGVPIKIPELIPETPEEKKHYQEAFYRRKLSLLFVNNKREDDKIIEKLKRFLETEID